MEEISNSLQLNSANSTTSIVLWSMTIFLFALIFIFILPLLNRTKSSKGNKSYNTKERQNKGF